MLHIASVNTYDHSEEKLLRGDFIAADSRDELRDRLRDYFCERKLTFSDDEWFCDGQHISDLRTDREYCISLEEIQL